MSTIFALTIIILGLALAALLAWVIYQLLPERVFLFDGFVVKKHKGKTERMSLGDISKINFHYHAVVGFVAEWEFVDTVGNTLRVDAKAKGIEKLILSLEGNLSGFSKAEFDRKFREGDVEDSTEVWNAT